MVYSIVLVLHNLHPGKSTRNDSNMKHHLRLGGDFTIKDCAAIPVMRTFTYWSQSNRWNDEVTKFLFHPDRAKSTQIPTHGNQNGISAENIWGSNSSGRVSVPSSRIGRNKYESMKLSHECISPNVYQDPHHTSCPNNHSYISTPPKKCWTM